MFNSTTIIILVLLFFVAVLGIAFLFFTRQTKNFFITILGKYRKRYVICHMRYQGGLEDVFKVVPNPKSLTQVGKYSYDLSDKYIALMHNKRKHFILQENNAIPLNFHMLDNEFIIFQAAEIQTALDNTVMEYLFSKKKELMMLIALIIAVIATLAIIYNIYELNILIEKINYIPKMVNP